MSAKIKISSKFLTVNGVRVVVTYNAGPWVDGVPAGVSRTVDAKV